MTTPLRLLIVDDSPLVRRVLRSVAESQAEIVVVGEATNGKQALQQVAALRPDVVTMDVHMPVMDGLETTRQIMAYYPTPILVITSLVSQREIDVTFQMLAAGALDVMEKPDLSTSAALTRLRYELVRRVQLLARVRVVTHLRGRRKHTPTPLTPTFVSTLQPVVPAPHSPHLTNGPFPVVVIGASTGGPRVVRQILADLPPSFAAAVIVVQHIAQGFGAGMAEWLADTSALPVALASEQSSLTPGTVLVAPDSYDLLTEPNGSIRLSGLPLLLQRPAIDIVMQSIAGVFGAKTIGVLLTGMGRDGAVGMQTIHRAGGYTITQDEATCAIYGMPQAAVALGVVHAVLRPAEIAAALQAQVAALQHSH